MLKTHYSYHVSKLLQILGVRSLADQVATSSAPRVVVNTLHPGACRSNLMSDWPAWIRIPFRATMAVYGRTTEHGSRTLVLAASMGWESHGEYLNDGIIDR